MARRVPFFTDIHLHVTLKSSNSGHPKPMYNIWEDFDHLIPQYRTARYVSRNSLEIAKYTQANLYKLAKGKVRVFFNSLYPIERGFINLRNIPKALTRNKVQHELIGLLTGMSADRVAHLKKNTDYFKEVHEEYEYFKSQQGLSPDKQHRFEIAKNFNHLKEILKDKTALSSIVTIEGAHVFLDKKMLSGKLTRGEMKVAVKNNIESIKQWEHPPFIVNVAHHFYHGFCGHAKSFFKIEIAEGLLNQKRGLDLGINGLGTKIMTEMLSNSNGKRIHIDTKHMSLKARKEYYKWLRGYNYINKNNNIPIICSHTGASGYKTMKGNMLTKDNTSKKNEGYLFRWTINISDEEIRLIHESKGLIGIMVDKTKLGGGKFYAALSKAKDDVAIKDLFMKILWDNIFQIIHAIGDKSAWDIITIGSDYDGAIQHIDYYDSADKMPDLFDDMRDFIEKNNYQKDLWFDYEPVEILNKIFQKNTMDFCERYFV